MLAHCETFRRPSLTGVNGGSKSSLSYGIAGVFTPHHQRAHGYARQLLRLLHYVMAPADLLPPFPSHWGPPPSIAGFKDASFSVLYSGVGDKYYASCKRGDGETSELGWEREKVTSRTWTVPNGETSAESIGDFIGYDDLHKYEASATEMMMSEFADRKGDVTVAILPEEYVQAPTPLTPQESLPNPRQTLLAFPRLQVTSLSTLWARFERQI